MLKRRPAVHALVPVKALSVSKLRLASLLTPAERGRLTLLMLDDVLTNLIATAQIDAVAVVSSDPGVVRLAARRNTHVFPEPTPRQQVNDCLNEALMFAAAQLDKASAVMVVPGDVPLVRPADYAGALGGWVAGVTAVRAHDGGTNAILSLGSDAMPYRFGEGSLERHRAAAGALGLGFQVVENTVWSRDVDSPADLEWLAEHHQDCASAALANELLRAKGALKRTA